MKWFQKLVKKEKWIVVLLTGLLFLTSALPVREKKEKKDICEERTEKNSEEEWQKTMEKQLKQILGKVEGIGRVEVFLTCAGTRRRVVEKDETETVFERNAQGIQSPYVRQEEYPPITGVLVVAKGGDDPVVVQNIQDAVQALFQVEPHKIKVMKMS